MKLSNVDNLKTINFLLLLKKRTMLKLLSNLPIEDLTQENDYIGIIEKGNLLKSFFLTNKDDFSKIKIFSIYGEWGSGKSTLMKYLKKELKGTFNTFFFEAWEFESDKNLSLSLLEFLVEERKTDAQKIGDELFEIGSKLLEGFAKSITFKTPILNFSADKLLTTIEEENPKTFLQLKKDFKTSFSTWEDKITTKNKSKDKLPEYNIVFIDDLDRCEPENVLNLLSAIKLLFTYGKKTIFLCGIDKKAVKEAVKNKYGDVVKANEYLEKIFDISFTMPNNLNICKLVQYYFKNEIVCINNNDEDLYNLITLFFTKLHFTNPRRIKKILNKYVIIKNLIANNTDKKLKLPNIIHKEEGTLFETYLTLYLLILKEFEPEIYDNLFNLSVKKANYQKSLNENYSEVSQKREAENSIYHNFQDNLLKERFCQINNPKIELLIPFFSPIKVDNINTSAFYNKDTFKNIFNVKQKTYEYYFTLFLYDNKSLILKDLEYSDYTLLDYKEMIANII